MLNLPQQTLSKIKRTLLHQQRKVSEELETLDKEDPVNDSIVEAPEPGTSSWEADVHNSLSTVKSNLLDFSKKIANSLLRLNKGTFGKCENCGKDIEPARLEAMPTATLCLVCSKTSKKSSRKK